MKEKNQQDKNGSMKEFPRLIQASPNSFSAGGRMWVGQAAHNMDV